MKFAFVSQGLPPSWSGQSVVIYRLLSGFRAEDYCLITQDYGNAAEHRRQQEGKLPANYHYLSRWFVIPKGQRFKLVLKVNIWLRALQIARIVRNERCEAIVACPGDFFDIPAAYLASRLTKTGFYPYLLDYYSQQAAGFKSESFAKQIEATMLNGAAGVIVPNEFMRDELRARFGVDSVVVRNSCDLTQYTELPEPDRNGYGNDFKIVYTGSIYNAHFDAFRNLIQGIKQLERGDVKLHLFTNQPKHELESIGIRGPVVVHGSQPAAIIPRIQREADLLFLPLAFSSPFPDLIRTSSPGKLGEYLAAGRPILVHAPADSFVSWYFRQHSCGLVVDETRPELLSQAINRILKEESLPRVLSNNALACAQAEFSVEAARAAFAALMRLDTPESSQAA